MLKFDVISSKFRMTVFSMVAVCGLLDLCILRLLPWLPTEFSKYVNGYPNLFALRCCMYGNNVGEGRAPPTSRCPSCWSPCRYLLC
jgi:hypothetical protein